MQFSSRFKKLCKENGVTQKQALADIGLHRNAAQRWSEGSPSTDALLKIAEYFGITTDEVLGVETKKAPILQEDERSLTKEMFFAAFESADESTREAIRLLLKVK